jgi:hypothetical protein
MAAGDAVHLRQHDRRARQRDIVAAAAARGAGPPTSPTVDQRVGRKTLAKSRRKQPTASAVRAAAPAEPPRPAPDPRAAERIARQRERATARRRQEQVRQIRTAGIAAAAVLLLGGIFVWWFSRPVEVPPGRSVPIVGWTHIQPPEKGDDYTTWPPTSGKHYEQPAREGVHDQPIPNEQQVHNLEHGQIVIQYTCADCPELANQLKAFAARYPRWVLVGPYPEPRVGARIALTAWGRIDTFDEYDEQRIVRFIEAYKNKGREVVMSD